MMNLIRMDVFRLMKTKTFWILNIINFSLTFIAPIMIKVIFDRLLSDTGVPADEATNELIGAQPLSTMIGFPFGTVGLLMIVMLVSAAVFLHGDIGHGYIKNLAGQIPKKSHLTFSKFIVMAFHHLIMMAVCLSGTVLGNLVSRGIYIDAKVGESLGMFMIRFLLLYALTSVLLLFSSGLGNKTLSIVMAVIFGTGALNLLYAPLDLLFNQVFHWEIRVEDWMPDALAGSIAPAPPILNSLLVGLIFVAVFVTLSGYVSNHRDVK